MSEVDGVSLIRIRAGKECPVCVDGEITVGWKPADSLPEEEADLPGADEEYDYICDCGMYWDGDISQARAERERRDAVSFESGESR